ncbi:MAG: diguanylate cyclase, partial [Xanthomonadales bacterium]|nr:diguanylate cyclase [Xanthomonadales bacterium]
FEDQVERQLALPESLPLTLLYIDLDQFKLINDTVSHADGDRLLRRLANLLSANLRSDEYLARLGGDEFGLVLCRQSTEQAQVRAEAFRRLIRELREPAEAHVLSTTASIGLVTAEQPGSRYAALLAAADAACFHAKEHGG